MCQMFLGQILMQRCTIVLHLLLPRGFVQEGCRWWSNPALPRSFNGKYIHFQNGLPWQCAKTVIFTQVVHSVTNWSRTLAPISPCLENCFFIHSNLLSTLYCKTQTLSFFWRVPCPTAKIVLGPKWLHWSQQAGVNHSCLDVFFQFC